MRHIVALGLMLLLLASTAQAAITWSPAGCDPDPNVSSWASATSGILGYGANGSWTIDGGSSGVVVDLSVGWVLRKR